MSPEKRDLLYEGKAKKVYKTSDPGKLILEFKDDLTAFNAEKKGSFEGKGLLNLKISNLVFRKLASEGIPTHFIENLSENENLVESVDIIPLEVVVRTITAGSLAKRLGKPEGIRLENPPLVEFYYKRDDLGDPLLTEDHIFELEICTSEELEHIKVLGRKINKILGKFFLEAEIDLIDFKIEFGKKEDGSIVLADEISPDSCRLWDAHTSEKFDKDRFRRDLGKVKESYEEVFNRISKVLL